MYTVIAEDVHYTYPDGTYALRGISLKVAKGEVIGITGPIGSGKTTLLLLIDALIYPQRGRIIVMGMEVNQRNSKEIRKRVGLVFQEPEDMFFNSSVIEEVAFGLVARGLDREEAMLRAKEELEKWGLSGLEERIPHRLSSGQKKLLSIACVTVTRPELLLLDEPSSNLDEESIAVLKSRIEELISPDRTLIVTGHDLSFMKDRFSRILVMRNGRISTP